MGAKAKRAVVPTSAPPKQDGNCDSDLHEWDELGGHCRHCGACDEYLGPHNHSDPAAPSQGATPTFNNADNFSGAPVVPAPDTARVSYGVRGDGTWGPIRGSAPVQPAVEAFLAPTEPDGE